MADTPRDWWETPPRSEWRAAYETQAPAIPARTPKQIRTIVIMAESLRDWHLRNELLHRWNKR